MDSESPLYLLGTSFGFEFVMLGLGAWVFCRRDYSSDARQTDIAASGVADASAIAS